MTGLSKITDKILAEAEIDAARILADADKKCAEIFEECKKQAQESVRLMEEKTQREAERIVTRAKTEAERLRNNLLRDAENRLVGEVFEEAHDEILSFTADKYQEFLVNLLISLLKGLYEEGISGAVSVKLSARDRDRFGKALIEGASNRLIGKIDPDFVNSVTLSKDTAEISGGMVLVSADYDINCSLSSLIENVRPKIEPAILKTLF